MCLFTYKYLRQFHNFSNQYIYQTILPLISINNNTTCPSCVENHLAKPSLVDPPGKHRSPVLTLRQSRDFGRPTCCTMASAMRLATSLSLYSSKAPRSTPGNKELGPGSGVTQKFQDLAGQASNPRVKLVTGHQINRGTHCHLRSQSGPLMIIEHHKHFHPEIDCKSPKFAKICHGFRHHPQRFEICILYMAYTVLSIYQSVCLLMNLNQSIHLVFPRVWCLLSDFFCTGS